MVVEPAAAAADHIPAVLHISIDVDTGLYEEVKLHKAAGIAAIDLMAWARMRSEVGVERWMRSLDTDLDQVVGLVNLDMEGMCIPV